MPTRRKPDGPLFAAMVLAAWIAGALAAVALGMRFAIAIIDPTL